MNVQVREDEENDDWDNVSYQETSSPLQLNEEDKSSNINITSMNEIETQTKIENNDDIKVIANDLKVIKLNVQILLDKIISIEERLEQYNNNENENKYKIKYNCTNLIKRKLKIF
jgi:hypothetical protein